MPPPYITFSYKHPLARGLTHTAAGANINRYLRTQSDTKTRKSSPPVASVSRTRTRSCRSQLETLTRHQRRQTGPPFATQGCASTAYHRQASTHPTRTGYPQLVAVAAVAVRRRRQSSRGDCCPRRHDPTDRAPTDPLATLSSDSDVTTTAWTKERRHPPTSSSAQYDGTVVAAAARRLLVAVVRAVVPRPSHW